MQFFFDGFEFNTESLLVPLLISFNSDVLALLENFEA
jgi:hypothetical protein